MKIPLCIFLSFLLVTWLPAAAVERIGKSKMVVGEKEVDVILEFSDEHLVVTSKKGRSQLKKFTYAEIEGAYYSYSKHRRWRSGAAVAVISVIGGAILFFMKGKKHWLTIRIEDKQTGFRLDKKNFEQVILAFENKAGIPVEIVGEE